MTRDEYMLGYLALACLVAVMGSSFLHPALSLHFCQQTSFRPLEVFLLRRGKSCGVWQNSIQPVLGTGNISPWQAFNIYAASAARAEHLAQNGFKTFWKMLSDINTLWKSGGRPSLGLSATVCRWSLPCACEVGAGENTHEQIGLFFDVGLLQFSAQLHLCAKNFVCTA